LKNGVDFLFGRRLLKLSRAREDPPDKQDLDCEAEEWKSTLMHKPFYNTPPASSSIWDFPGGRPSFQSQLA
jgi:hypothetical protein